MQTTTTIPAHECLRCGHVWPKRDSTPHPVKCPGCKNIMWNRARVDGSTGGCKKSPPRKRKVQP